MIKKNGEQSLFRYWADGVIGGRRTVTKQPQKNYRGGLQVWYGQDSGLLIQNKKMRRKLL